MIFREGDPCDGVYSILSGMVSVYKTMPAEMNIIHVELARLGPGALFGEMGIFQPGGRRDANVKALEFTQIIIITPAMLEEQIGKLPSWAGNFFRILVERLQITNERLLDATAKLQEREASVHVPESATAADDVQEKQSNPSTLEDEIRSSAGLFADPPE